MGAPPYRSEAIKLIPDLLRPLPYFLSCHHGVRGKDFWPKLTRNKPMSGERNSGNPRWIVLHRLFPVFKVDGSRKRHEHDKLSEGQVGPLCHRKSSFKSFRPVAGQAKDERAQHLHAMFGEKAQALDQFFSR